MQVHFDAVTKSHGESMSVHLWMELVLIFNSYHCCCYPLQFIISEDMNVLQKLMKVINRLTFKKLFNYRDAKMHDVDFN